MSENKIKVISCTNGRCGITYPDLRIAREWNTRGSVNIFTEEQLEELMFRPAFANMVKSGMLYIEDMATKKKLGVEPEEATEPTIKQLTDAELNRLWKIVPFAQFKLETSKLTTVQKNILANYAMTHGDDGTIEKANYLESISGYKILKGIEFEKADKEA